MSKTPMSKDEHHKKTDANPAPGDAPLTYADAGVAIDAGHALVAKIAPMAAATRRAGADGALGGFGALFDLKATGYKDPILVAATDGVGTKLKIAVETGLHDTIGQDLVAMCVNDLLVQGAEPLFFLDYFSTGTLETQKAAAIIAGIARACRATNCALIGGETAEMPGLYAAGDYDLAGFAVGAVERAKLLPRSDIAAGDMVIGLASSGLHSNGFSLVRAIIARCGLRYDEPAPFAPAMGLGAALLAPTRLYVGAILALLKQNPTIKALAHITGGGLTDNLPRVLPHGLGARINLAAIRVPPAISWLAKAGNLAQSEILRTFNCGVGFALVCAPQEKAAIVQQLFSLGESAFALGHIVEAPAGEARVVYDSSLALD